MLGDTSAPAFQLHWVSLLHHVWILLFRAAFQRLQQQLKSPSVTTHRTQRTASLNMSADSSNGSHPTWNQRHTNQSGSILLGMRAACLLIHQDEFQYFNLSRTLQLSAVSRAGTMWSSLRKRILLKSVTVKLTFCNSDIVCVCITIFHYSCTIVNQMPRYTGLNDKHHYICIDAKNPAVIPGSTNPSELNQNECILQSDKVKKWYK